VCPIKVLDSNRYHRLLDDKHMNPGSPWRRSTTRRPRGNVRRLHVHTDPAARSFAAGKFVHALNRPGMDPGDRWPRGRSAGDHAAMESILLLTACKEPPDLPSLATRETAAHRDLDLDRTHLPHPAADAKAAHRRR